jgi:hypothetical protein
MRWPWSSNLQSSSPTHSSRGFRSVERRFLGLREDHRYSEVMQLSLKRCEFRWSTSALVRNGDYTERRLSSPERSPTDFVEQRLQCGFRLRDPDLPRNTPPETVGCNPCIGAVGSCGVSMNHTVVGWLESGLGYLTAFAFILSMQLGTGGGNLTNRRTRSYPS